MKHIFIVNPKAGKGGATKVILPKIIAEAKRLGLDYEIHRTLKPGDARLYTAKKCQEYSKIPLRIYAVGGDGTFNEVINGAVGYLADGNLEVAVIPTGTGDDFVRNFKNAKNFKDIESQVKGRAFITDLIECYIPELEEGTYPKYAVNMCNIGFDAEVVSMIEGIKKKTLFRGSLAYLTGVVIAFIRKQPVKLNIFSLEGQTYQGEYLLTAIANGKYCGGGFMGVPLAELNDGLIDVSLVNNISRSFFMFFVKSYHEGTHLDKIKRKDIIKYFNSKGLKIKSDEKFDIAIDGEPFKVKEVEFKLIRNVLPISVPEGAV